MSGNGRLASGSRRRGGAVARTRMVVVGGDAAGMSAAAQARKRRPPEELEIVAFERGRYTSYSACGLPYYAGDVVKDWRDLVARTPEEHAEQDIEVRTGHEVEAIDLEGRRARVRDLDGGRTLEEPWDVLVVATGSEPLRPPIDGIDLPGVYGLSVLEDGIRLREAVDAGPERAVIVGGGYIGLEAAEALVNRGIPTALVEAAPQVMGRIDPDMGELVSQAVRDIGVELGPSGAIAVNPRLQARHDGVWAAGDCAEAQHLVSGKPVSYHLGTIANKQGRICGINIGGGYATFPGVLGTAVSKVCEVEVARTGLSEAELGPLGLQWEQAAVDSTTRAGYFPGAAPIRTKVLAERRSGRLLGAQIVGKEGAAKRIDVFATAIWNGMTAQDMVNLDLSYAPPFSPVWDPVLIAVRKLSEQVERSLGDRL